jgi:hypothetical protein
MTKKPASKEFWSKMLEGNRGGSYVRLTETDDREVVRLEVGHDCVVTVRERRISVFALAAILTRCEDEGFENVLRRLYDGDDPPEWARPY